MPASPPTPSTSAPTGDQLRPPSDFRNLTVRRLLSRHGQLWHQLVSTELTSVQFGVLLCLAVMGFNLRGAREPVDARRYP